MATPIDAPYRLKTVVVGLTFVSIGLISLIASLQIPDKSEIIKALLRELATIAIIGATLHVIHELFQRQDFIQITNNKGEEILKLLNTTRVDMLARIALANQAAVLGMTEIMPDAQSYDFDEMLLNVPNLTAVLNDGRTWVANNALSLQARFQDKAKHTTIVLVHPQSEFVTVLARKQGIDDATVRAKLAETLRRLVTCGGRADNLRVLGHRLYNPHTVFITDGFAIITPYFHSRTRHRGPAIRFNDTNHSSFYRELRKDIDALVLDCEPLPLTIEPPGGASPPHNNLSNGSSSL
jgi:hypothetical protein